VQQGQAHQPFQEIPDAWNARVDAFWQDVEARSAPPRPRTALSGERHAAATERPVS
jgi:3-oxoadipate enol-lactonase